MKIGKLVVQGLLLLGCLSVCLPRAAAQYRAGIRGVILDAQGDTVAAAKVTLTNLDTNKTLEVSSDGNGVYTFLSLPPGHYRIDVEKDGFKKKTLQDVEVAGEQTQAVNITVEVGEVTQSVIVSGDSVPVLDTETGNISGTLSARDVQNLPSLGRDPFQLLRLAPGVFGDGAHDSGGGSQNLPGSQGPGGTSANSSIFQTENQVQVNANGQRNTANSFQVDGVSVNSLDWGGAATITPNEESIKEVRVTANSYDAQFGRTSGAQIELVSQNGTNDYHGSLFLKIDRPGLNAFQRNFGQGTAADQRATQRFNQIGGSVGGAIIKNRLFVFFSYETLRDSSNSLNNTWAETPQFLAQGPTGSIANALLTFPGEGTAIGAIIPRTCADAGLTQGVDCNPVGPNGSQGLDIGSPIKGRPLGTHDATFGTVTSPFGVGGGLDGIPDIAFVQTQNPTQGVATQYNGRLDFQATKSDLITFSTYFVPNDSNFFNGNQRPANFWHSDRLNESAALLWEHTFAPTLINEARFNVSRWYFNELQTNPQEPFGLPQDVFNTIGNIGGFTIIFGANGPGIFYKTSYNFHDGLTKVHGRQTLKFGFDLYRDQNTDVSAGGALPQYLFNNPWDFLNDAPVQENANFNPLTGDLTQTRHYIRSNSYAGYVQDDIKLKPNFTVNVGLRWEYFGPIYEKFGNLDVAQLGPAADPLTGASVRVGGNLYNSSHNNWGPQIGFAWSPGKLPLVNQELNNRLVIRGGFGIGYSREEEAIALNGRANVPQVVSDNLFNSNILYAASSDPHNFNGYPANPNTVVTFNPTTNLPASGAPVSLVAFDPNLPTPVTYRYSLGTQYDLGHNWVFSVGYQGSLSRHYTRNENLNLVFNTNLNPQIQNFQRFTNDSNGSYNALLVELRHKFSSTFELDGQYIYAKTEDNVSGDFNGDFSPGVDPFDRQAEFAPADFDVRHTLKVYGVWTPRIFRGSNNWAEKILGNWTITGIATAHTGFPFTPFYNVQVQGVPGGNTCSLVYANSGFCTVRPASYLGGAGSDLSNAGFEEGSSSLNFANPATSYFTAPDLTNAGVPPAPGVARNAFRGPRYSSIDATLGKAFGLPRLRVLGENAKLDFRANFYNLFNQLNLTPLGSQPIGTIVVDPTTHTQTVTSPNGTFGVATNALAGRIIEGQVRFSF